MSHAESESEQSAAVPAATPGPWWKRAWRFLRSRFAKQLAVTTVVIGAIAATGHFIGGMIGWWHAYEITFGGRKTEQARLPDQAPGVRADAQSLIVLPFVDESENPEGDWLADSITSDLTAEMGRMPGALVMSLGTARTYKGKVVDPREVAKELGVRYVIRGSARRSGERVRLDVEMVDGDTGLQSWSQQIELERSRLALGLGEVGLQLARTLNVQTFRSSGAKVAALKPNEMQADDLAMQGWATYFRGYTPENLREASSLFELAVQRDPRSTRAWGGVAFTNGAGAAQGWVPDRDAALRRLAQATEQLRRIDENAPFTMMARMNLANRSGDWQTALAVSNAMLQIYPSHAPSQWVRGQALIGLGRFGECLEPLHLALRIGPRDPMIGLWHYTIANCHFMRAEYSKAAAAARTAWQANPRLQQPPLTLAAALHRDGEADEARKVVADARARHPNFRTAQLERLLAGTEPRFVEGRQRLIDSLRALGMQ